MLEQVYKYSILGQPLLGWMFLISFLLAFVFLYRIIKLRGYNKSTVQFTYFVSLIFTLSTIALTIIFYQNQFSFWIFLLAVLPYWIIYFGWTPKWSPFFILTFLWALFPMTLANYMAIQETFSFFNFEVFEISEIVFLGIPIELFYIEFLLSYLGVLVYEKLHFGRK